MDDLTHRLANLVVGNPRGRGRARAHRSWPDAALRPAGRHRARRGGDGDRRRRRRPPTPWSPIEVAAGSTVTIGAVAGPGLRACLAVRGGFAAEPYLGSRSTFTLGNFGGHDGRALRAGDVLDGRRRRRRRTAPRPLAAGLAPVLTTSWELGVLVGPHSAPDFLTAGGADGAAAHRVGRPLQLGPHRRPADRPPPAVGPRRTAARPACTRRTSTTPATPSAPSTSPATCRSSSGPTDRASAGSCARPSSPPRERWKLGQLAPGDRVRLVPWTGAEAAAADDRRARWLARATATDRARGPAVVERRAPGRGRRPTTACWPAGRRTATTRRHLPPGRRPVPARRVRRR